MCKVTIAILWVTLADRVAQGKLAFRAGWASPLKHAELRRRACATISPRYVEIAPRYTEIHDDNLIYILWLLPFFIIYTCRETPKSRWNYTEMAPKFRRDHAEISMFLGAIFFSASCRGRRDLGAKAFCDPRSRHASAIRRDFLLSVLYAAFSI